MRFDFLSTLAAAAVLAGVLLADLPFHAARAGEPEPVSPPRLTASAVEAPRAPAFPERRTQIAVPENNPVELYPPSDASLAQPLTVALHGMDMDPTDLCETWNEQGRTGSWLACPAGNGPAGKGSTHDDFDWSGTTDDRLAALDAQLAAVDAVYGPLVDHTRGDVLVGFSRGGFLARDLVYARPGRFRGLVLLGAAARLDPARLHAAGVRRVLLAAGEYDDARKTMEHTAQKLVAHGIAARFVGLGRIGHVLPADLARVMKDALAWVREEAP